MSRTARLLPSFLAAACAALCLGAASDPAERLADPAAEARAREIFREVRCLVCQNESIDDSNAELAADLRRIVREQVAAGRTDAEVRSFLTDRYGEFVLLKPVFSPGNAALWLAPFAVAGFGLALLIFRLRARAPDGATTADAALTAEEDRRLRALTQDSPP